MKFTILIQMLFDLLSKRTVPARYFAEKYNISERTVYRYVDCLAFSVPVYVKRGRNGGICLSDNYKLPVGFMTQEEYEAAIEALTLAYAHSPENRFLSVKQKLSAKLKSERRDTAMMGSTETFLFDGGTFGNIRTLSEKLRLVQECIKERAILEMQYHTRYDGLIVRRIEPHLLLLKQNVWYFYAFCRTDRKFRLYHLGRILSASKTGDRFLFRPFRREDIPLAFWTDDSKQVDVRLQIADSALLRMQEYLGADTLRRIDGTWYADVTFPNDDTLPATLLSLGEGVRVLFPTDVKDRVLQLLHSIKQNYKK